MARASKKHIGKGAHEKGDAGPVSQTPPDVVGENQVLSNRDKSQHSKERGQDSKWIEAEQSRTGEQEED